MDCPVVHYTLLLLLATKVFSLRPLEAVQLAVAFASRALSTDLIAIGLKKIRHTGFAIYPAIIWLGNQFVGESIVPWDANR